jgi:hypothetical protein
MQLINIYRHAINEVDQTRHALIITLRGFTRLFKHGGNEAVWAALQLHGTADDRVLRCITLGAFRNDQTDHLKLCFAF